MDCGYCTDYLQWNWFRKGFLSSQYGQGERLQQQITLSMYMRPRISIVFRYDKKCEPILKLCLVVFFWDSWSNHYYFKKLQRSFEFWHLMSISFIFNAGNIWTLTTCQRLAAQNLPEDPGPFSPSDLSLIETLTPYLLRGCWQNPPPIQSLTQGGTWTSFIQQNRTENPKIITTLFSFRGQNDK